MFDRQVLLLSLEPYLQPQSFFVVVFVFLKNYLPLILDIAVFASNWIWG
jgi:hypothetical protein